MPSKLSGEQIERLKRGRAVWMFDYDGTLSPIVRDPDAALLPAAVRRHLKRLATLSPVFIISGRKLSDVRRKVGIERVGYVGNHGFEVCFAPQRGGPSVLHHPVDRQLERTGWPQARKSAKKALSWLTRAYPGSVLEDKVYSLSLHYRNVHPGKKPSLLRQAKASLQGIAGLQPRGGKQVLEVRPDVAWHKGEAVLWIIKQLNLKGRLLCYVGDDETDEDAFRVLQRFTALTIRVGRRKQTCASYYVSSVADVHDLIGKAADLSYP